MSGEPVKVWVAMDPEQGNLLLLVNRVPVGTIVNAGGQITLNLEPEYLHLGQDLARYFTALFANMPETLRAALYESAGFLTNTAGRDAAAALPDELKDRVHLGCGGDVRALAGLTSTTGPARPWATTRPAASSITICAKACRNSRTARWRCSSPATSSNTCATRKG